MTGWLARLHRRYASRRSQVLSQMIASLIPAGCRVLDVGCGDGRVAREIMELGDGLRVEGLEVVVRADTQVPVHAFDGERLPFPDDAFDAVLFVDVLHHTQDPTAQLREAARVARRYVLLKDHTLEGFLAGPTLRFMDRVGNPSHVTARPSRYWTRQRWQEALHETGLREDVWEGSVPLFPAPLSWLFGRSLHFVARLEVTSAAQGSADGA